jgi:hypothetical protein
MEHSILKVIPSQNLPVNARALLCSSTVWGTNLAHFSGGLGVMVIGVARKLLGPHRLPVILTNAFIFGLN